MAKDPNKIYLPNGTEVKQPKTPAERKAVRAKKDEAYKASRERFAASREKYKNTPMPAKTAKEKEYDAKYPNRVSGAAVAAAKKAKRVAQAAPAKTTAKPKPKTTKKPGLNFMNPDEALRKKKQREIDNALKGGTGAMNSKQYDAYLKKMLKDMNKK